MLKIMLTLAIATLLVASTRSAEICSISVQEALAPCWCDEDNLRIDCSFGAADTDLKTQVFDRVSPLLDDSLVFKDIQIIHHNMSVIPANFLGNVKTERVTMYWNSNLNWVHPDAFDSTYNVTRALHLDNNNIMSTEENTNIFTVINKFSNLEEADISNNKLSYIPDDAFPEVMATLKTLNIGTHTGLEYWGARFFANLPALEKANFTQSKLTLEPLSPATFEGIGPNVLLTLTYNNFSRLPEEVFGPVLKKAAGLRIGSSLCLAGYCWNSPFDCDEGIDWICEDVGFYQPKLEGYYCQEGIGYEDIWAYCEGQNNNNESH